MRVITSAVCWYSRTVRSVLWLRPKGRTTAPSWSVHCVPKSQKMKPVPSESKAMYKLCAQWLVYSKGLLTLLWLGCCVDWCDGRLVWRCYCCHCWDAGRPGPRLTLLSRHRTVVAPLHRPLCGGRTVWWGVAPHHHNTTAPPPPHPTTARQRGRTAAQYGGVAAEAGLLHLLINTDKQSWRERPLPAHQPQATTLVQHAREIN